MSLKESLREQFRVCFLENGWFVATGNAFRGISAEQAAWRAEGSNNSIWQLLSHLNYYNNAYLERFRGNEFEYRIADNDETFVQGDAWVDDWQAEVARFESIVSGWISEIENADEARFNELAPPYDTPWWQIILNICAHSAHHGGQIVLLRKLQGSWDIAKGVS